MYTPLDLPRPSPSPGCRLRLAVLIFGLLVGLSPAVGSAEAALPGGNGKIAFSSIRAVSGGADTDVWAVNPDGTGLTNFMPDDVPVGNFATPPMDDQPAFSPDGTKIAFESRRDLNATGSANAEIYVMNADGTGQTRLTNITGSDLWPSWSPDGTKIAFYRNTDIATMDVDGPNAVTDVTVLTESPSGLDTRPTWSPDGSKIAFVSTRDAGDSEIYVMNADGTNETNITNSPGADTEPNWSPDGTKLAFRSERAEGGSADIWTMNPDGTGVTNLTPDGVDADVEPAFSPDGTKIAFSSSRDPDPAPEIHVMNADGSGIARVVDTGATFTNLAPDWQPIPQRTLTVAKTGTGQGTVTSSPPGIDCGADCSQSYDLGTQVTLTATAAAGSSFDGFSGAGCSGTAPCVVTLAESASVTATFVLDPFSVAVTKAGSGQGTVTSVPLGIDCGSDCSESFVPGTQVTLTATLAAGSTFTGFSGGGCSGTATTCTVTVNEATPVTATFAAIPRALTVTKAGTGSGTVTSSPAGIDCGADCSENYDHGTAVTLTASPAAGSTFTGFSGGGCSGAAATCTLTLTQAESVTATFALIP
ncbi:MAG: InlB B-repeat-containing protein, partial [Gammaproteobacteria bacterium]